MRAVAQAAVEDTLETLQRGFLAQGATRSDLRSLVRGPGSSLLVPAPHVLRSGRR